jgi:8-oxo-dGTP pyrophosphatase MutT (NUDIX family)
LDRALGETRSETVKWRPADKVRAVSIGLAIRDEHLLVVEVLDDTGTLKGWRPPGGGVEFGEAACDALQREFREELGCDVSVEGTPWIFENIYKHEGATGREIVFAFPIRLLNRSFYERSRFKLVESEGTSHWAEWIDMSRFKSGEHTLFPGGLIEHVALDRISLERDPESAKA